MQQATQQRKRPAKQPALAGLVNAYLEQHPDARRVSLEPEGPRERHLCPQDWGQPPAEDYLVYKPPPEWRDPAMKTRRDNEIQDALLSSAERWWLERHPDDDYVVICAKSRLTGNVFRYRCRPSSAIVRWVKRRWEREKLLAAGLTRCSCIARDEPCPLCVEARAGTVDPYAEA